MIGAFIASTSDGAPCCQCGKKIRTGTRVFYERHVLDDSGRTCADCVSTDLFGGVA